jgi:hypothetical protein
MTLKIILLLLYFNTVQSNYIIFENIGQMATAVTYINTKVTIKTDQIEQLMIQYRVYIENIYKQFRDIRLDPSQKAYGDTQELARQGEEIMYAFLLDYQLIRDDFYLIKWLLPVDPTRAQRFLDVLGVGLGAMGTFLGIYNSAQIASLKNGLANTQLNQDRIVHTLVEIENEQKKLKAAAAILDGMMTQWKVLNPALFVSRASRMEKLVKRLINKLYNCFQMAQAHRLAIDFIDADKINDVYEKIRKTANAQQLTLITQKPIDLFQLEVSYFSNGTDLHIIIHVPAVPQHSLLQLYKMHPLPLPINKNQVLVPHVKDNVLGLSHGSNKLAVHMSSTDLLDCKVINKVFLCERHAVLHKHINASCMGALYQQNFESATKLCPLQIQPIKEIVHQLAGNWFLIFTPLPQTAAISCLNGTESQFYLPEGISKRHLSAGCRAEFIDHVLMSDNSITLENSIQHFDWTWMKELSQIDNLTSHLQQMHDFGFKDPTMKEINDFQAHGLEGAQYKWHISTIIISLTLTIVFTLIFCICCTNKVCLKKYLAHVLFPNKNQSEDFSTYKAGDIELEDYLCRERVLNSPEKH